MGQVQVVEPAQAEHAPWLAAGMDEHDLGHAKHEDRRVRDGAIHEHVRFEVIAEAERRELIGD